MLIPKLRMQFAEFLHHDSLDLLGILYLTTCVGLGYGQLEPRVDAFLDSTGSPTTSIKTSASDLRNTSDGFAYRSPYILARIQPFTRIGYLSASHLLTRYPPQLGSTASPATAPKCRNRIRGLSIAGSDWTVLRRYGNINPLSIDYACRPRLRSRLTQGRLA